MKFLCANRIAPDGTPRSAASHLGLYCLPMSHKGTPVLYELSVPNSLFETTGIHRIIDVVLFYLTVLSFSPKSTIFKSCRDGAIAS